MMLVFKSDVASVSLALPDRFFLFLFCVGKKKGQGTWSVVVCVSSPAKLWGEILVVQHLLLNVRNTQAFCHLTRTFIVQGMLVTCISEAMNQV